MLALRNVLRQKRRSAVAISAVGFGVVALILAVLAPAVQYTHLATGSMVIFGSLGSTVGMIAMGIAYFLGYRNLHLFGYDSSQDNGQHHAYDQKWNDGAKSVDVYIGDLRFTTSPSMAPKSSCLRGTPWYSSTKRSMSARKDSPSASAPVPSLQPSL